MSQVLVRDEHFRFVRQPYWGKIGKSRKVLFDPQLFLSALFPETTNVHKHAVVLKVSNKIITTEALLVHKHIVILFSGWRLGSLDWELRQNEDGSSSFAFLSLFIGAAPAKEPNISSNIMLNKVC